jgi:hypothetical protein
MRTAMEVLLLAVVMATLTVLIGWWAVPIVAALWGALARGRRGTGWMPALAAALAWAAILVYDAIVGAVGVLADRLGEVMGVPAAVLPVLTLAFPALLAWSAAYLAGALLSRRHAAR